jgi:drug/metabolite transporter (DMT)-like permease
MSSLFFNKKTLIQFFFIKCTHPTGSISLISNNFFGHFLLHEKITRWDMVATSFICLGAALVAIFGIDSEVCVCVCVCVCACVIFSLHCFSS